MTQIHQLLNKDIKTYVTNVEKDLMFEMLKNMSQMQATLEHAENLSREFLSSYPYADKEILIKTLADMGKKYPEAFEVYIKYANDYYHKKAELSTKRAASHIKKQEIELALKAAKGGNR